MTSGSGIITNSNVTNVTVTCQVATCFPTTLTTTYTSNNAQSGNMFDLVPKSKVLLHTFDVNMSPGTFTFEIRYRVGTWVGNDTNPGAWTLLGSATVTSSGSGVPTPIPIDVNLTLNAGQTYGFYLTVTGCCLNYTNGTAVGDVAAEDAYLRINQGAGIAYPFAGTFMPRIWNGTIHYEACS